ncbi:MAG: DNA primase [Phycisphaerales bacterium]|nr:DNA primase [Phycisphaerales bacterium]
MIPNRSSQSDRDRVLESTDLVALVGESVVLRPKGREHVGLCPFHEDHKPSFSVVTHKSNAFYNCFSCGASGNAIDFMINFHRMDFPESLAFLAQRAGFELQGRTSDTPRASDPDSPSALRRANDAAVRFFQRSLADSALGAAARDALSNRSIDAKSIETFSLGAAPASGDALAQYVERLIANQPKDGADRLDHAAIRASFEAAGLLRRRGGVVDGFRNRIIFPIADELGRCIAFGARAIDPEDQPKYLNSPETALFHKSKSLYGIHLAKRAIIQSRTAIITEGYTDVIACHSAGIENAVATLGTALTREHARVLQRLCDTIILLFDGDSAGQRAADRALELFFAAPVDLKICTLPDQLDPDELLRQPNGRERFDAAIAASEDALAHMVGGFRKELDARPGLSARQRTIEALLTKLLSLGLGALDGIRRRFVIDSIAQTSGVPASEIERALLSSRRAIAPQSTGQTEAAPIVIPSTIGSPGRGRAERDLLSILLAWPSACSVRIATDDGDAAPLSEFILPASIEDPAARAIYEPLFQWLEEGKSFAMQDLLAELVDPSLKALAIELFEQGTNRFAQEVDARAGLMTAATALDRLSRRHQLASAPAARTPEELAQRLNQIRAAGPRPSAIARTARSAP